MIINLNTKVKVQLNELGKKIWLHQIEELPPELIEAHPDIVSAIKNQIDDHNCVEMELWALMNLFGPYMNMQQVPFTSTTIEVKKNPNFKGTGVIDSYGTPEPELPKLDDIDFNNPKE